MKRKLALILAGVMAMTMLPMNLMAASSNRLTRQATAVPEGSMFYEEGLLSGDPAGDAGGSGDVSYALQGGNLKITLKDDLEKGDTVEVKLSNAKWFFRSGATTNAKDIVSGMGLSAANPGPGLAKYAENLSEYTSLYTDDIKADFFTNGDPINAALAGPKANYDKAKGAWLVNDNDEGFYVRGDGRAVDVDPEVNYKLSINDSDSSVAVMEILEDVDYDDTINVPLVCLTTEDEADVRVRVIAGATSNISSSEIVYALSQGGGTSTSVDSVEAARKQIKLGKVVVKESRIASIGSSGGSFEISAPTGYSFSLDPVDTKVTISLGLRVKSGVAFDPVAAIGYKPTTKSGLATNKPTRDSSKAEDDVLLVHIPPGTLDRSTTVAGSINLANVTLKADSGYEANGKVELKIKNVPFTASSGTKYDLDVTNQTFLAADFLDWTVSLSATSKTIPQLVNGRFVEQNSSDYDDFHQASTVVFKENALSAWWSQRDTAFKLPAGVKFREVEFTDSDHIVEKVPAGYADLDLDGKFDVLTEGEDSDAADYIDVNEDSIEFYGLQIESGEKAMMEFDSWLSIASDFVGDVTLTASGSAIPEDLPGIVIAKAIAPVTVKTKVTDIKIGYQYQPVADIEVTENLAGALVKDKEVRFTVTDMMSSTEMLFSPETKIDVTTGDLKLGTKKTGYFRTNFQSNALGTDGNSLGFVVDKPSSKASTIKLSNVAVKVDRTVPETNDRPYDVYVWGSAIAENYQINPSTVPSNPTADESKNPGKVKRTCFDVPGVHAPYLKVVSAANDKTNVLTQEVRVTKEQPSYSVNGEVFDMPAAAYISTDSNSMMVPLRFVANAFGIADDQIIYSDTDKTVTLVHPLRTIQFKTGSSTMKLNGTDVVMTSPDGLPVTPENKDSRVYVPFRQIGIAFGIEVGWDQATSTAIYNPGKALTNNGSTQTATATTPATTR